MGCCLASRVLAVLGVLVLPLFTAQLLSAARVHHHISLTLPAATDSDSAPKVAIVNAVPFHNEVYTALLHAALRAGADVTAFVRTEATEGMEHVIQHWLNKPLRHWEELLPELCDYDVVVFSTFPDSHLPLAEQMLQKECRKQTWAFTVHDPREIDQEDRMFPAEGKPRAWAILKAAPSAHVLTLAPHVTARYTEMMAQAGLDIPVATFLPIYPVDTGDADAPAGPPDVPRQGFVLQGMFQSQRRDYGKVFRDIEAQPELMADPTFRMNLIGRGSVEIPAALQSRTVKETSLQYQEYYKRIQGAIAVLPAFATNVYTTLKASSSVAAALVCATPLVADDTLLAAYSYLNATAVFRQEAGETEAATMARIMRLSPPEIRQVAQNMADLQQQLFLENDKVMLRLLSGRR